MFSKKGSTNSSVSKVNIHPLVLLSVVDHYNRVAQDTDKRVVGILLGTADKGIVEVTNSYAVPFEEDPKNPNTWYFDHNYHEAMYAMSRKVNATEYVVGWYSSSVLIRSSDLQIHEVVRQYVHEPVFAMINIKGGDAPARCYITASPDVYSTTTTNALEFTPVETVMVAEEAEEVGVEHILRGISNIGGRSLSHVVSSRLHALSLMLEKLQIIYKYINDCAKKNTPVDKTVVDNAQTILSLIPDMTNPDFLEALQSKQADNLVVLYVAHLTRIVTGLHDLLKNKILNREAQRDEEAKRALLLAAKNPEENLANDEGENDMDTIGQPGAE